MAEKPFQRLRRFFAELKRRKVYRVAAGYLVAAFVVLQLAGLAAAAFGFPGWFEPMVWVLSSLGFPIAVVLAWAFEITPEGIQRTPAEPLPAVEDDTVDDLLRRVGGPAGRREASAGRAGSGHDAVASDAAAGAARVGEVEAGRPDGAEELAEPSPERVRRASLAHLRHDLRTPTGVIDGYVEMLLEDARETGWNEVVPELEKLRAAGQQLHETVEEALDPRQGIPSEEDEAEAAAERFRYEIREHLNAVIGYGELVLERCRESGEEELAPDLNRVLEASRQLLKRSDEIVELFTSAEGIATESERLEGVSDIARDTLARIRPVDEESADREEVRAGHLLVVDDNALNRSLMARQLARQGYSVTVAEGGREALEMIEVQDFDLVLLDILMPGIDGIEVLHRLRANRTLQELPVIMTSSLDEVDSAVRCLEAGADDYIARPVEPAVLRARVAARLETQRMRKRNREQRQQLAAQEELVDRLVTSRLPAAVADRVLAGDTGVAEAAEEATVLSLRLMGTEAAASRWSAVDFVRGMGRLLGTCRNVAARHDMDAFFPRGAGCVVASGIPSSRPDHAEAAAETALELKEEALPVAEQLGLPLQVCVGVHSGRAVAGLVGEQSLHYDLWGEAQDVADELAKGEDPGSICVTPATYSLLRDRYRLRRRGVMNVAGGTQLQVYLLEGRKQGA